MNNMTCPFVPAMCTNCSPSCGSPMKRNGKTKSGSQRWRCVGCGAGAPHSIDTAARDLAAFVGWLLSKESQVDMPGQGRTFRRRCARFWAIWPMPEVVDEAFRVEPVRYIGEALNVYILLEQGDKMLLIDKHAAHERILFDKMRLNEKPLIPQELLEPQPFNTDPDGAALLEANAALLARLGFELDAFGDTAFLIRAVPAQLDAASAVPLLEELLEKLREGRSLSSSDVWERLAATVACKAAIKGGWVTEREELLALAEKVLAGEVTHCPHGRPVMTVFTRAELDKRFGRIV